MTLRIKIWDRPPAVPKAQLLADFVINLTADPTLLHLADAMPIWEPCGLINLYLEINVTK